MHQEQHEQGCRSRGARSAVRWWFILTGVVVVASSAPSTTGSARPPARAASSSWVKIPGGTFTMGSKDDGDTPTHKVTVSSFELMRTEVTLGDYQACERAGVCSRSNQFGYKAWQCVETSSPGETTRPIECVTWEQANAYCVWADARLPTEAEWEYAARNRGKPVRFPWGNKLTSCEYAIMHDDPTRRYTPTCGSPGTSRPVCSRPKGNTTQGLCDMAGNVMEWVGDWFEPYSTVPQLDPKGPATGTMHTVRGGCWFAMNGVPRITERWSRDTGRSSGAPGQGFRCAR